MMTTSLRMQSAAGCIIFLITSGLLFIGKCEKGTIQQPRSPILLHQGPEPSARLDDSLSESPFEFIVTLTNGEKMYLLARNSMDAAYSALELSEDRNTKLLNVRLVDEWFQET